jgi:hypothetical protein
VSRKTDKYGEYEKSKWVYHDGSFDRRFDSWWNLDMGDQGSMARAPCRCQLLFQAAILFDLLHATCCFVIAFYNQHWVVDQEMGLCLKASDIYDWIVCWEILASTAISQFLTGSGGYKILRANSGSHWIC